MYNPWSFRNDFSHLRVNLKGYFPLILENGEILKNWTKDETSNKQSYNKDSHSPILTCAGAAGLSGLHHIQHRLEASSGQVKICSLTCVDPQAAQLSYMDLHQLNCWCISSKLAGSVGRIG